MPARARSMRAWRLATRRSARGSTSKIRPRLRRSRYSSSRLARRGSPICAQDSLRLVDLHPQRLQAGRSEVAADAHAVAPTGEEEVGVDIEQGFRRGVARHQLGQRLERGDQSGIGILPPAADAGIADHARLQTEGDHHLGEVDVVADRARRRALERHFALATAHAERVALGQRGIGAGEQGAEQQVVQERVLHAWVIQVRRGWSARGWRSTRARTPNTRHSRSASSTSVGVPWATMRPPSST